MIKTLVFRLLLGGMAAAITSGEPEYYTHETKPGDYVKKVDVVGRRREYRLHVPSHYDGSKTFPVIFAFHGSSASASVIERETSLNERGDSLNFFVVYPEGLHRAWNIGECCRYSFKEKIDEVAFVNAIIDQLSSGFMVDTTRIYATGYSDGGTLSYILGCTIPNRIAAVAGMSGTLFMPEPKCDLPHPVPAMIVHGTGDHQIPYEGEKGGPPDVKGEHETHSAPEVTEFWLKHNECHTLPDTVRSGNVLRASYACKDGAEVLFYTILGGKHGWPGGGRGWIFSPVPPKDMIATDSVVKFFLKFRQPEK